MCVHVSTEENLAGVGCSVELYAGVMTSVNGSQAILHSGWAGRGQFDHCIPGHHIREMSVYQNRIML